jgi:hypothetical protein
MDAGSAPLALNATVPPKATIELSAQDGNFVAEHDDLDGQIAAITPIQTQQVGAF